MAEVSEILERHLDAVRQKMIQAMSDNGRTASGKSADSLRVEVDGIDGTLYGSASFLTMEHGRRPGAVPANFVEIIKQWIVAKGISVTPITSKRQNSQMSPEERGLNSLAGAIAFSIMKNGTKLYRDGGYNDIYDTAIEEELEEMADEVLSMTAERITDINENVL